MAPRVGWKQVLLLALPDDQVPAVLLGRARVDAGQVPLLPAQLHRLVFLYSDPVRLTFHKLIQAAGLRELRPGVKEDPLFGIVVEVKDPHQVVLQRLCRLINRSGHALYRRFGHLEGGVGSNPASA
jgi:hypothetical protein